MKAELFDAGYFHIEVPTGWMAFFGIDSECRMTNKKVHICKGAKLETDIFTHACITVCFYDRQDSYISPKFIYDNVRDMESFTLGEHTWYGYTCTSLGYPYTMLVENRDGYVFHVMILMKNGEYEISLDDEDVKMILESLKQTN